ncbi:MAG: hypothetical protein C5B59_06630 [Bacteroidetes bacterium]|nr:MAG: hypothetical protein C5B59_06630 [Bacteroidota bacterium]
MKKATKKTRINKFEQELGTLKLFINEFLSKHWNRKTTIHSVTPQVKKVEGADRPVQVNVAEFVVIVKTAGMLGRKVQLDVQGEDLVVKFVEEVALPYSV